MKIPKTVPLVLVVLLVGAIVGYLSNRRIPLSGESDLIPELLRTDLSVEELMKRLDIFEVKQKVKAPEFTLPSLDGQVTGLKEYSGRLILLAFWATW
ncbi:MAG: redoxin domain-containing protein [Nitrospirae bacterium]|nr:redoxin domain-containing protein [Nitrospirota bacterium]